MTDTPELPLAEADPPRRTGAAPAKAKPKRDNRRWTTGDDGQLLDKVHMGWPMDKIAFSLERTTLGCLNRLQRILGAEVPTPAGFDAIVAELKNRAAQAKQAKQVAKTAAKKPTGPAGGNGAACLPDRQVGQSLVELHRRMGRLERGLIDEGRMRQLMLAIDLAAGRVSFDVLVGEIGAAAAGQCRRLANDILGRPELPDPQADRSADAGGAGGDEAGGGQS